MKKSAATEIPLSPEEAYQASQLLGRGLFGLTQLMQKKQPHENIPNEEATLSIPIPLEYIKSKTAAEEEEGLFENIKQNPGKYLFTSLGAGIGGYLGNKRIKPSDDLYKNITKPAKGALLGSLLGLGLGHFTEKGIADIIPNQHRSLSRADIEHLRNYENAVMQKFSSENTYAREGLLSRLFQDQSSPMQSLVGAQEGFANARKDFFNKEKQKIENQIRKAQQEYIDVLSKIKTGEENTPCVDAFCNGIAHSLLSEKKANAPSIEEGSINRVLGNAVDLFKKPVEPVMDAAAGGLLNTAASSAYLTYLLRKKMRQNPDNFMEEKVPTKVELVPYE